MPKLTIRDPHGQTRELDLSGRTLTIGRGEQNDVVLPDSTKSVSRQHAELRYENGQYVLVDLNSQNGLWVGDRRLETLTLETGVPVLVGSYTLGLSDAAPVETTAVPLQTVVTSSRTIAKAPVAKAPALKASFSNVAASGKPVPKAALVGAIALGAAIALAVVVTVVVRHKAAPVQQQAELGTAKPEPTLPPAPSPEDELRKHLSQAREYFGAKAYDDALREADAALAIDPANAEGTELRSNIDAEVRKNITPPPVPPVDKGRAQAAPPPPPAKPATPPAATPPFPQRPNESQDEWFARGKRAQDRYDTGKTALTTGQFQNAIASFTAVQRDEPSYRDVPQLLAQAIRNQQSAIQTTVDGARQAEAAKDLRAALAQFRRAQEMGAPVAADIDRVVTTMRSVGAQAFKDAQTYAAFKRVKEAISSYERAYDYLADEDPNRKIAKEKLDALRGRP